MSGPEGVAGRLAGLHRYPVKSLTGERLDAAAVDRRGLAGDRLWSVRDGDGKLGSGKSSSRFRAMEGLMLLSARYDGDVPVVDLGDGRVLRGDDPDLAAALSAHVGRPVTLAREAEVSHFDDGPLHLLTTSSLAALARQHGSAPDVRRFRPNLVVDTGAQEGFVEDDWVGRRVAVGEAVVLRVVQPMPRCVMVTQAQRGLAADAGVLRSVTAAHDAQLGVLAEVVATGRVAVGDAVRLLEPGPGTGAGR